MTDPTIRTRVIRGRSGTTGPIGQPVQNPLGDLEMSPEAALYVGTLEGQLAAYSVNEVKYRVLLELITGESWYSTKVDVDTSLLADIATESLVRRGMDGTTARTLVNKRLSFGVGEVSEVVPAVPVQPIPDLTNQSQDMSTRFRRWRDRQRPEGELPRRQQTTYVPPEIVIPPTTELVEPLEEPSEPEKEVVEEPTEPQEDSN